MYGLKDIHIQKIKSVFENYLLIEKAILYGSRAKGNFLNGSDIDICLCGNKLDLTILNKIENDIDDLLLPYKVDISLYHKIENTLLKEHINRVGLIF